jgi:hypothetical protein
MNNTPLPAEDTTVAPDTDRAQKLIAAAQGNPVGRNYVTYFNTMQNVCHSCFKDDWRTFIEWYLDMVEGQQD